MKIRHSPRIIGTLNLDLNIPLSCFRGGLTDKLLALTIDGVTIQKVDECFGHIQYNVINPSIDLDCYLFCVSLLEREVGHLVSEFVKVNYE